MTTVPSPSDLSARLAQLSPERRALLERALRKMAPAQPAGIARRDGNGPAPLSYAQEFLWLIEQAYPGRAPYNVPRAFRVRGPLDVAALESALGDLVERHAVLRTRIEAGAAGVIQRVAPAQPVRIERVDAADDAALHTALREHARRPFDLAHDQLLRALLVNTGANEAVLQLVVHHVTSDGWSRNVTLRDLGALYAARRRGERATLEPLPIDYADYAVWQRTESERSLSDDLGWWRAALENAPVQLDLPTDRPRTGVPSFAGARLTATIPRQTLDALAELARRENASLFMVLLAAYGVLLHRHTGQTDLVIGSPVAGRAHTETHSVVGLFANTLALRVRCDGDPTFAELLGRVRGECLNAFEHQSVPFERLASELQRERSGADGTLVQTLFSLHDAAPEGLVLDGATTEVLATEPGWSKADLTIAAAERPDGLGVLAEYRTDLFDRSTIERLVHHFDVLLGAITTDAHRPISALPLLDAAERSAVVAAGTGPRDLRAPACVHRMVEATVATKAQAIAVVDEQRALTYAELDAEANRLARHLIATGIRAGDAVAICLPRRAEMVVALLATLKAGAHYVPLDPAYPADRLAYILEDSNAKVVIAMAETRARVPASARTLVVLDESRRELAKLPATRPDVDVGSESLAYVLHTSGSTGKPKGVMVPHRAVWNFLRSMAEKPGLAANDAVVAVTTLSFDIAGLELWLPLVVGARVAIAPRSVTVDGGALVRLVDRTADAVRPAGGRVLLQATPATWRLMLDASWSGTPNLRMLCGGEAWSADLATPLLARGESLWNVYGPTETTIWSSVARVVDPSDVSLGEPIANTTLLVLDARREPVPIGVAGELYIGGAGVALGYLGRADLTAERFVPDPFSFATGLASDARMYRTGDLVRRRADGALEYLGRIDQQVKVRGFRIELGEVESALVRLDAVQQAVVVVRGASADARLVAYVVPRGEESVSVDAMRVALRRSLPDYMVPAQYVVMRELPLTPNGKIDRRALPEPDASGGAKRPAPVLPRTPIEARIAEVWRDVLGVSEVGIEDDFFALGGHSLLAMRVVARLANVLPVRVTIGDLFEGRTIAALAALVEAPAPARASGTEERIVRAVERGTAPLSLAQQAVWTAEQRTPDSAAYHAPIVTHVRGALDVDALQRAVDAVVARHEALRTTFEERGGEPVQVVHEGLRVPVEQMDLRGAARVDVDHALQHIVRDPFALSRGPLLRVRVVRVAEAEWIVALVVHHLVFDGGSEPILLRELGEAYAAVVAGNTPFLAPNAIEIADWARWERTQVAGTRLDGALRYWRETLAGAPAAIALPTDAPLDGQDARDGRDADRAARVVSVFSSELHEKVTRLARTLEATPFMVLLAGFQAVLSRFARQDDLVIGTPVSRRDRAETQPLIGFLTNTIPLRATLEPATSFADLVVSARERLLSGVAHSSVPVERIAAELGGGALFDTLFVLQEARHDGGLRLAGCTTEPAPVEIGAAKVDLSLSMTPTAAGLRAALIYRVSRFGSHTAERLLEHLGRLLDAAADDPTAHVADLPLLGESDRATLAAWNDTRLELDGEHTVHELVAATAARTPYAVAVEDEHESLSYEELEGRASHLAQALREAGIGPGKLVGISAERSVGMVVGLLGILKAGGAYVPIDPEYPADRVTYMLADSGVSVLLTQTHLAGSLPAHGAQLVLLDDPTLPWAHDDDPPPSIRSEATPDDAAYMIYTSGSTGRPKGALNAHRGIVNRLAWMQQAFGLGSADVVLQKTPMSFDVSVWEFFWPLLTGAKLVMARPGGHKDPAYLADVIARAGVTVCHFVPSMLRAFVGALESAEGTGSARAGGCRSLRAVMASGEALAPDLVAAWYRAVPGARLHNLYGPTECAVDVSWWACPPSPTPPAVVPIGAPIANTRLYVLDARGAMTPIGVPGELHLAGVQVGLGYHNRPELTAERFVPDSFAPAEEGASARMYRTGDLARWRVDGTVEYLGRLDFQVKIRGFRIELGEIETVLLTHPSVRDCVVDARTDVDGERRLVAYLVAAGEAPVASVLRAFLLETLPEHMVPGAFVVLEALPLSSNGKVDRRALPDPRLDRAARSREHVAPRSAAERALAEIWSRVLRVERVGVTDDFFELGGDSLLSIQIVAQAARAGLRLTLTQVLLQPTIAGQAAIATAMRAERDALAPRVTTEGEVPLTPVQRWFAELDTPDVQHWNQAFLFTVPAGMDHDRLRAAIGVVASHHDALRLRFRREDGGAWRQWYATDAAQSVHVVRADLGGVADTDVAAAIAQWSEPAQRSLDLESGPVGCAVHFELGASREGRVLLVLHHFVVDGVSWRVLREDLESAYEQLGSGSEVQLPPSASSFAAWSAALQSVAASGALQDEVEFWAETVAPDAGLAASRQGVRALGLRPRGLTPDAGPNVEGNVRVVELALSVEETRDLLQRVPAAYGTRVDDALVAALSATLAEWLGAGSLVVDLEGHGREEIAPGVDVSRTVGWFTSVFPVRLALVPGQSPRTRLIEAKETLRRVPRRGVGYGILRYLRDEPALRDAAQPEVMFNYLGQFDQVVAGSTLFGFARESAGAWRSARATRRHLLEIIALVIDGRMTVRFGYAAGVHDEATIQRVADGFGAALRGCVAHCLAPDAIGYTPSDFPLAGLDQDALDRRFGGVRDVEDVYPATPLQRLFLDAGSGAEDPGFQQYRFELEGPLDTERLREAWELVASRHDVLRTRFLGEKLAPLAVVQRRVDLPWRLIDWRGVPDADARLASLLADDRARGFDMEVAPLMRVALVRHADERWTLVWTQHHLLLDRWSWPIVLREVGAAYDALRRGEMPALRPAVPFRDYVAWLAAQPEDEARSYWTEELAELGEPLRLLEARVDGVGEAVADRDEIVVELTAEETTSMRAVARAAGLAPNVLVESAWAMALAHLGARDDVTFGLAIDGRGADLAGADEIVGVLVNNVPARARFDADEPLGDWLAGFQRRQAAMRGAEHAPLEAIQRWIGLPWRHRLFETLLVFQDRAAEQGMRGWLGGSVAVRRAVTPTLTAYPVTGLVGGDDRLTLTIVGDRRLVPRTLVEELAHAAEAALRVMTTGLDTTVGALRRRLPPTRPFAWKAAAAVERVAPRSATERVLARIWGELLGTSDPGVTDNFFALGGHSLLATQIVSRVRETLQVDIPVRVLFQHPTVADLATALTAQERKAGHVERVAQLVLRIEGMSAEELRQSAAERAARQTVTANGN